LDAGSLAVQDSTQDEERQAGDREGDKGISTGGGGLAFLRDQSKLKEEPELAIKPIKDNAHGSRQLFRLTMPFSFSNPLINVVSTLRVDHALTQSEAARATVAHCTKKSQLWLIGRRVP
jgi:hypothetical protein